MRDTTHGSESGQSSVEYALILACVALGCLAAVIFLSGSINGLFGSISNCPERFQLPARAGTRCATGSMADIGSAMSELGSGTTIHSSWMKRPVSSSSPAAGSGLRPPNAAASSGPPSRASQEGVCSSLARLAATPARSRPLDRSGVGLTGRDEEPDADDKSPEQEREKGKKAIDPRARAQTINVNHRSQAGSVCVKYDHQCDQRQAKEYPCHPEDDHATDLENDIGHRSGR